MSIISWIILGGIAGWIASKFTGNDARMGVGLNILVGIIGAFLGGWIVSLFGVRGVSGFNIWSLLVAILGAVILLLLINAVFGNRRQGTPNV
ncbi:MAG TPA: GlsB/YeaQ/YmgE family stress response membrane protein [Peptococcaceae bacterium]|nr:GlsB/YeaQ/YmgE family stress response membrane protein [Peptococcaceae bacterium]